MPPNGSKSIPSGYKLPNHGSIKLFDHYDLSSPWNFWLNDSQPCNFPAQQKWNLFLPIQVPFRPEIYSYSWDLNMRIVQFWVVSIDAFLVFFHAFCTMEYVSLMALKSSTPYIIVSYCVIAVKKQPVFEFDFYAAAMAALES